MSKTTPDDSPVAKKPRAGSSRFHPIHAIYGVALFASALAVFAMVPMPRCDRDYALPIWLAFGSKGVVPAGLVLAVWSYVFSGKDRLLALAQLVLGALIAYCLIICFTPPINVAHEAARRTECNNNMKIIGLALQQYHDAYDSFPPVYLSDQDGEPQHSWRVLILPYLDQQKLYDQYRFDEPWNGPTNRLLLAKIPRVYQCPSRYEKGTGTRTSYLAVIGPRTVWPEAQSRRLIEVTDPLDSTLLLLESDPKDVDWMAPQDISFEDAINLLENVDHLAEAMQPDDDFFYHRPILNHPGGRIGVLADGSVMFYAHTHSADYWRSLLTIDDGTEPAPEDLRELPVTRRLKVGNTLRLGVFLFLALLPLPWVLLGRYA